MILSDSQASGRDARAGYGSAPRKPTTSTLEAGTTPFHATHITLHEIAHMLLGHERTAAGNQFARLLAPDVDEALIQLILGRSAYSTTEERDAETLASLILELSLQHCDADGRCRTRIGH